MKTYNNLLKIYKAQQSFLKIGLKICLSVHSKKNN